MCIVLARKKTGDKIMCYIKLIPAKAKKKKKRFAYSIFDSRYVSHLNLDLANVVLAKSETISSAAKMKWCPPDILEKNDVNKDDRRPKAGIGTS